MTVRWPIHPQPRGEGVVDRESIISWLMRQAQANAIGYGEFIGCVFGNGEWVRKDLDLLSQPHLALLTRWGSVQEGPRGLYSNALTQWAPLILPAHKSDRHFWISSLWTLRYCPLCFHEDKDPYLRLIWRLHVSPICLKHRVLLRNTCQGCGKPQPLTSLRAENGIGACKYCGVPLSKARATAPRYRSQMNRFADALPTILDTGSIPSSFGWTYSARDFFDTLMFLVRLIWQTPALKVQKELRKERLGLPQAAGADWRKDEQVASRLLNESLKSIQDWPENFKLLEVQRSLFFTTAREFGDNLPVPLIQFRVDRRATSRKVRIRVVEFADREVAVRRAVDLLVRNNQHISPVTIRDATGIDYRTLLNHPELVSIMNEGRRRLKVRRRQLVEEALAFLKERRERPTHSVVAAYMSHRASKDNEDPTEFRPIIDLARNLTDKGLVAKQ